MLTYLFERLLAAQLVEQLLDLGLALRQLLSQQMQQRHEHERVSRARLDDSRHRGQGWPPQAPDHVLRRYPTDAVLAEEPLDLLGSQPGA
jgi:hypothetical protein